MKTSKITILILGIFLLIIVFAGNYLITEKYNKKIQTKEKQKIAYSFKERLVLYDFLVKKDFVGLEELLLTLLSGDVLIYEEYAEDFDYNKDDLCEDITNEIRLKLSIFYEEMYGETLSFSKFEAACNSK